MATTTTIRNYLVSEFPNHKVNLEVLKQQVADASLSFNLEVDPKLVGPQVRLQFAGDLTSQDLTNLDAVVAAHTGVDFAFPSNKIVDLTTSQDTGDGYNKLSLSVGPLKAGDYFLSWSCEIRVTGVVADSGVSASLSVDGSELATTKNETTDWTHFGGVLDLEIVSGQTIQVDLDFSKFGAGVNTAEMRRSRIIVHPAASI